MCTKRRFDCDGASADMSDTQREWCCEKMQKGCGDEGFVCDPAIDGAAPHEWSAAKKTYCCDAARKRPGTPGCDDVADKFNCRTKEEWSFEKHTYCCAEKGVRCPAPAFDCDVRRKNMTKDQRTWCCDNQRKGCKKGDLKDVDCSKEKVLLSKKERKYCCKTENLHCKKNKPKRFSCKLKERDSWTEEQSKYCCKNKKKGCAKEDEACAPLSGASKTCAHSCDVLPKEGTQRAKWCCAVEGVGCPGDYQKDCESSTTSTPPEKCCQLYGISCKADCPAYNDKIGVAALDAESKKFCCDTLGVACPPAPTTPPAPLSAPPSVVGKPPSPVDTVMKFVVTLLLNWDEIMRSPKVFVDLLLETLAALLAPKGFKGIGLQANTVGVLQNGKPPGPDDEMKQTEVALKGIGQTVTTKMSTAAAMRVAQSLGLRVHRHGTPLRTSSYSALGGDTGTYIDMQASGADAAAIDAAVTSLTDTIQAGTTTNEGSAVALNPIGSGLIPGEVIAGTTLPPAVSQTPKAADSDSDSGSDMVLPLVLGGAGALLCGGMIAFVVMKKQRGGSAPISTQEFTAALPPAEELQGTSYTSNPTGPSSGGRGRAAPPRAVIESGRI